MIANNYGSLFKKRSDKLLNYELKFTKVLSNSLILLLTDLEEILTSLDYDFKIRKNNIDLNHANLLSEDNFIRRFAYRTKELMKNLILIKEKINIQSN